MISKYDKVAQDCSSRILSIYSTSFSLGSRMFRKDIRMAIASIYGFVRLADEIVDTFHDTPQAELLEEFWRDTELAIERKMSTNPVLQSFQRVVHEYNMEHEHIWCFLRSMKMDLSKKDYDQATYEEYILGSAEVVGLMCLHVFVEGDEKLYRSLKPAAMKLGSAFQKVNFLRDIRQDNLELGRQYFPNLGTLDKLDPDTKKQIENEIALEFDEAFEGIKQLPGSSRLGVGVAYVYYRRLLSKIQRADSEDVMMSRIRVPNGEKFVLMIWTMIKYRLSLI